ncbi:MAG: hypothetical protein LBT92_03515, partial [Rickettsiales bacterium]|nr:hypothetical protein [Rickettsiales bacterium]
MPKTSILDCTFRDGGYNNDWTFGRKAKTRVPRFLAQAGIETIEMGFLWDKGDYTRRQSLYTDPRDAEEFIPKGSTARYLLMVTYGRYDLAKLPPKGETRIDGLRIIFRPRQWREAMDFIAEVKDRGYFVSCNPMQTFKYTDAELSALLSRANEARPDVLSIVDSFGSMFPTEVEAMARKFDDALAPGIALGFHSHDNLGLALPSSLRLAQMGLKRDLVLDAALRGLGRGAGNLRTEIIAMWLNGHSGAGYNIDKIFEAIDGYISVIHRRKPWRHDIIYGLSAMARIHPDYATFLIEHKAGAGIANAVLS